FRMRLLTSLLVGATVVVAQTDNKCPTTDLACHDLLNSSQCISQVVDTKNPTKEALIQCVVHEGTASNLSGGAKYCRCPGCHTKPLNDVIQKFFPPPCSAY
ncbi:hypothetical protein QBC35DRAFT_394805, partial [Podospora australis]